MTGTIKTLRADKGFGFIRDTTTGKEVFFHSSAIYGEGIDNLRVRRFGVPDRLFDHATRDALLRAAGLTPEALAAELEQFLRDDPRSTPERIAPAVTRA